MGSALHVAIAGATGALGGEILTVLDRVPWRPDHVSALASLRSSVSFVDYGDQSLPVDALAEMVPDDRAALVLFGADPLVSMTTLQRLIDARSGENAPAVAVLGFRPG